MKVSSQCGRAELGISGGRASEGREEGKEPDWVESQLGMEPFA